MGYYTRFQLEWQLVGDEIKELSCSHDVLYGAKFCHVCGKEVGFIDASDCISKYIDDDKDDMFYAIDSDGQPKDSIKWYSHEADMITMSQVFPNYLFTLHGEGEESGDIWRKYFLNGEIQITEAKITFDECVLLNAQS